MLRNAGGPTTDERYGVRRRGMQETAKALLDQGDEAGSEWMLSAIELSTQTLVVAETLQQECGLGLVVNSIPDEDPGIKAERIRSAIEAGRGNGVTKSY